MKNWARLLNMPALCSSNLRCGAMKKQKVIRAILFVIFFGFGAAALTGAILCDDLLTYYQNKQFLKTSQVTTGKLESLNTDYDVLLEQLQRDPNLAERIAPAALGTESESADTINPAAHVEQLVAAGKALTKSPSQDLSVSEIPEWLTRCSEPRRRVALFLAGAFLIIISFVWFDSAKQLRVEK